MLNDFKNEPLVSIGMPVYNGESYIAEALTSLLNQNYTNFEIFISNNASKDSTASICEEFLNKDYRVKYYCQSTTLKPMQNFEFVFNQSRGSLFMWAAADDLWHPDFLSECVKKLNENEKLVAVNGKAKYGESSNLSSGDSGFNSNCHVLRRILYILNPGPNSRFYSLYRRRVLEDIKISKYDFFAGDWALYFDVLKFGPTERLNSKELFFKRVDEASGSSTRNIINYLKSSNKSLLFPLSDFLFYVIRTNSFNSIFYIPSILYQNLICIKWLFFDKNVNP
jgi:glycosyltransferase involved in cell wall biosynthesis